MGDQPAEGKLPLELLELGQAEGYCDPVTGVCVWPGPSVADDTAPGGPPARRMPEPPTETRRNLPIPAIADASASGSA